MSQNAPNRSRCLRDCTNKRLRRDPDLVVDQLDHPLAQTRPVMVNVGLFQERCAGIAHKKCAISLVGGFQSQVVIDTAISQCRLCRIRGYLKINDATRRRVVGVGELKCGRCQNWWKCGGRSDPPWRDRYFSSIFDFPQLASREKGFVKRISAPDCKI